MKYRVEINAKWIGVICVGRPEKRFYTVEASDTHSAGEEATQMAYNDDLEYIEIGKITPLDPNSEQIRHQDTKFTIEVERTSDKTIRAVVKDLAGATITILEADHEELLVHNLGAEILRQLRAT